ncbi:putative conserved secreted protein [Synechococcus sp. A15-127]|mgnify:CR=1 FL=1|jgi:cytoskeletal protein CcmA (bactofilin family)|uniref:hypothetical protein n=1 Tax=Synechococcus sp. A15-127 TaxID=1050624 RepID=UPI001645D0BC|nr:hypothetical protein [Synechococcus sp. A15-127]QNI94375.1 putative conserved secreted protein [Synechococcus sp. A15-127]
MTTSNRRDELLLAYRWPAAIVVSSIVLAAAAVVLAWTAVRLLKNPIPVRIEGGLDVERLVMPAAITIRTEGPLPVTGTVGVKDQVEISGQAPLAIKGPITVRSIEAPVKVGGAVTARVDAIEQPISVTGTVKVDDTVRIGGSVKVEGKVGADVHPKLLPIK